LCKEDLLYWINTWVLQYNPNAIGSGSEEFGPFVTWDFQDALLRQVLWCIEHRRDLVIEKSREMGASWLCLLAMDWLFLFHPRKKFLMISRDERTVDKPGDSDSLFWKLDFVHDHLPGWMTRGVQRRKLGFSHSNRSSITGQASTGKAGVGGRATAMFIDEFSQIDEDYEVFHRTSDTTGCRIFNGTHRGPGTCFHELTDPRTVVGQYITKVQLHWSQHPDKRKGLYTYNRLTNQVDVLDKQHEYARDFNFVMAELPSGGPFPGLRSPWYDEQCKRKGSSQAVAMDLDIDVTGSTRQFFDQLLIRQLTAEFCTAPLFQGDVDFERDTGRPLGLSPSGGPLQLWCRLHDGKPVPMPVKIGGDLSTGSGATNSCLSGVNAQTGEKVFEYAHPGKDPRSMAYVAVALGWLFKDEHGEPAELCWEQQGPGVTFGGQVLELGYRRVYYHTMELPHTRETKRSERPGWVSNPASLRVLLEEYRAALANRRFLNRSEAALAETLLFRYTARGDVEHGEVESRKDPSGARVNHGDRVIADALAWKLARGVQEKAKEREKDKEPPLLSWEWRRQYHRRIEQKNEREEWGE
jgi:hypothetical protein